MLLLRQILLFGIILAPSLGKPPKSLNRMRSKGGGGGSGHGILQAGNAGSTLTTFDKENGTDSSSELAFDSEEVAEGGEEAVEKQAASPAEEDGNDDDYSDGEPLLPEDAAADEEDSRAKGRDEKDDLDLLLDAGFEDLAEDEEEAEEAEEQTTNARKEEELKDESSSSASVTIVKIQGGPGPIGHQIDRATTATTPETTTTGGKEDVSSVTPREIVQPPPEDDADVEETTTWAEPPPETTEALAIVPPIIDSEPMFASAHATQIIARILDGYDSRVRPAGTNGTKGGAGPVVVKVNILLRSISKIDNVNMEYSVQMTFREEWMDPRLSYTGGPPFVILDTDQKIWMPDSFFQNEKQAHRHVIDKPNVLIRVHSDGQILYSVRLSMVLSCPMHLQYYPMDIQTCLIDIASYAYTADDIEYQWKSKEPLQLKAGLGSSLPSFLLKSYNTTYCTSTTNTGTYSCLRTQLVLKRQFSYYLLQLYIPSTMLVIVSWVSFWLDRTAVPARVTLGVTTLLTMTTQASGINSKLPPVAYIKAIDVWIGACLTFIFGALLEFALVTFLATRNERLRKTPKDGALLENALQSVWIPKTALERSEREAAKNIRQEKRSGWLRRIWRRHILTIDSPTTADVFSRVAFPMLFIFFNGLYWSHYARYQSPLES